MLLAAFFEQNSDQESWNREHWFGQNFCRIIKHTAPEFFLHYLRYFVEIVKLWKLNGLIELKEKCKCWFNFVHVLIFLASQGNIWNYLSLSFADFLSQFYFSVCRADLIQHQYRAAGTSEHLGSTIQISNGLPKIFRHKCLWHIIQRFVKFWTRNITSYLFDYFTIVSLTAQTDKKVLINIA